MMKIKVPEERSLCQSLRRSGENPLRAGHPDLLAGSGLLREGQILKVADKIAVPACLGLRQLLPKPFGASPTRPRARCRSQYGYVLAFRAAILALGHMPIWLSPLAITLHHDLVYVCLRILCLAHVLTS